MINGQSHFKTVSSTLCAKWKYYIQYTHIKIIQKLISYDMPILREYQDNVMLNGT